MPAKPIKDLWRTHGFAKDQMKTTLVFEFEKIFYLDHPEDFEIAIDSRKLKGYAHPAYSLDSSTKLFNDYGG